MKARELAVFAVVLFAASCASWRLGAARARDGRSPETALHGASADQGLHPAPPAAAGEGAINVSETPGQPRPAVPPTPPERAKGALYYSDMGPDTVDVAGYPTQTRYDYQVFAKTCSRCHTLARAINAPLVSRGWWEFYILGMRMRSRRTGQPLAREEIRSILDFLEYDSRVRKVEKAREFDALTEELKSRFDASVDARLKRLQQGNKRRLLPREPR